MINNFLRRRKTKTMKKCPYYNRGNCQYFHGAECLFDQPDYETCSDMYGVDRKEFIDLNDDSSTDDVIQDEVNETADFDNGAIE